MQSLALPLSAGNPPDDTGVREDGCPASEAPPPETHDKEYTTLRLRMRIALLRRQADVCQRRADCLRQMADTLEHEAAERN